MYAFRIVIKMITVHMRYSVCDWPLVMITVDGDRFQFAIAHWVRCMITMDVRGSVCHCSRIIFVDVRHFPVVHCS